MPSYSPEADDARHAIAARSIPGLGDAGVARELAHFGSARALLAHKSGDVRARALSEADDVLTASAHIGAAVLTPADDLYPWRLRELHQPPAVLFARGTLASAEPPAVAIVGTRVASSYGVRVARAIATACARSGATVVSGLAAGIDGAAHDAALAAGGRTVGVLGTGIDVVYPRRHVALQERIAQEGLLLSELPPGQRGHGGTFPRRNRIIAALADVTVVVEAGEGSGALITASYAHELHRAVACVPNAIDIPSARGSNALMKEFAEPILSPDDVLEMLALRAQPTPAPILDEHAAACWYAIEHGASCLTDLMRITTLPMRTVAAAVTALELEGLIVVDAAEQIRLALSGAARRSER